MSVACAFERFSQRFEKVIFNIHFKHFLQLTTKKQPLEAFYKKTVLKNFTRPVTLLKIDSMFFCECCKIFKNIYFEKHLRTAAFDRTPFKETLNLILLFSNDLGVWNLSMINGNTFSNVKMILWLLDYCCWLEQNGPCSNKDTRPSFLNV